MTPPPPHERRQDYQRFKDAEERLAILLSDNQSLVTRLESLEKIADEFKNLQNDIKWLLIIAKFVGAVVVFFLGDTIKKKVGL